jgi:hypothetical protein
VTPRRHSRMQRRGRNSRADGKLAHGKAAEPVRYVGASSDFPSGGTRKEVQAEYEFCGRALSSAA